MKKFIRLFKQISVLILAITILGCDEDETVIPSIVAGFTYTLDVDTGTVTFINISENADTYAWNFGDQTTSKAINPVKTYENGTYIVILTVTNSSGASDVFQDEITISKPVTASLPITFDASNTKYEVEVFNGTAFEIVDNPAPGGTNNVASKVGAITNIGVTSEGIFFDLGMPIDLSVDKTIKMNFWADTAVDVLLRLEEGSTSTTDTFASHTGSGWEEISFDLSSSSSFSRLVILVDDLGDTAGTFYIDDIEQVNSGPAITLIGDEIINILLGSTFTDPGATAIDGFGVDITSNIVISGDTVDTNTAGTYIITYNASDGAGNAADEVIRTVIVAPDNEAPVITLIGSATINVTTGGVFTDPGATASDNIDGDISNSIVVAGDSVDVNTEGTYVITYNVSDAAGNAAIQVERTVVVAASTGGGGTGGGGLASNGDFETGTDSGWIRFQNGGTAVFDNTINNGGSWSGRLETGGASNPAFKQERFGIGEVAAGNTVTIKFDHIGEYAGEGGILNVLLFIEGATVVVTHVFNPAPLLTTSWTTFTGSYTIPGGTDVSGGISFLIEAVCGGAPGCSVIGNIDNVSVTLN